MTNGLDTDSIDFASLILKDTEELSRLNDVDAILDKVLHQARRLARADAGSIFLKEDDGLSFNYVQNDTLFSSQHPNKEIYTSLKIPIDENSIVGFVATNQQTLVIDNAYELGEEQSYHFNKSYDQRTGYRTISMLTMPLMGTHGRLVGVMQIINASDEQGNVIPFAESVQNYMPFIANNAATAIERGRMNRELVLRMMRMAELRDPKETGPHVQRVGAYSAEIYKKWAFNRRKKRGGDEGVGRDHDDFKTIQQEADRIRLAAMLHDVGKVGIADAILKKPGSLTDDEYATMKNHTIYGSRLFTNVNNELDLMCHDIIINHHERWDGKGYPGDFVVGDDDEIQTGPGRKGEEIPLPARITALADVYDALCSIRSYKEGWPEERVLSEIKKGSGTQFDPEVVEAFFEIHDVVIAIKERFSDGPISDTQE
jgi:HD-GYP domain-containing protein (c-di-GMP phosphodiesterase class II)